MSNYIRLTIPPGNIDQSANTILINASRTSIPANIDDSFFITPIRPTVPGTQVLYYNTTTKEVTHGISAPPTTAIWGVWGLERDVGNPIGGIPGSGRFVPANGASYTGDISANPAEMKSIAINLEDCTGPVSSLMGISGTLSASGGYHIVVRGWDLDCSGLDVHKMQAKYAITLHTIVGGAAIFDVSYNNSSGVFQGEETAPIGDLKYYNIVIAQDVAPMGPTGGVGVTGPTGSPAIAASSVWMIAEDPSVGGAASTPVATEFNIENAGGFTETNPALVTEIDINIQDCNGVNWELLRDYGYLIDYYIVIRGWDSDCSGEDIYQVQTKYRITSTAFVLGVATFGVSYVSSYGIFEGPSKYYNIIVGADVAPMGPTGFTGATGTGGGTGPTGTPAIAASSVWMIAEDPSGGTPASIPVATEFNIENAGGFTEENPALVTEIDINIQDCNGVNWELLRDYGYLIDYYIVIRGWDSDCSGEDIYQVQTKYRITSTAFVLGVATFGVSYVSSYGIFEGPSKYYNIIVGADVAPMGPTGFTGATGTAGVTGPTGRSAIAVSSTWILGDVSGNPASVPSSTEFIPVSGAGAAGAPPPGDVQIDPALTTQIRINSLDCHLDTTENTELLIPNYLTGQKLVIRGYNDDCSGTIVEKVQAEYRITGHSILGAPPESAYMEVAYISSAGDFGGLKFHNIIIGADIAPIGPTGPCCTGPTGPKGPTGLPAIGAVGVWGLEEIVDASASPALANGFFVPVNGTTGNVVYDPSSVSQFRINTTDCTSMLHDDMADAGLLDGAFIVVRGWDASCSGANVYEMHAKYRLVSHSVTLTTAYYNVTYVSSAGDFGGPGSMPDINPAFYNIILGSDIAEMGPTGPCCTGMTGATGPQGVDGVGAAGVWLQEGTLGVAPPTPGPGGFSPIGGGFIVNQPNLTTSMELHIDDCYDVSQVHLETDAATIGAFLVVRGYSDDCSGGEIFLVQSKHRITGHTYAGGVTTLTLTYMSSYGTYGMSGASGAYHTIIIGADPAPVGPTGPTGPCCTGPTGPAGSAAIVASSRWQELGGAPGTAIGTPGDGEWLAGNSAGNITIDPSSVAHFRINEEDCLGDIQSNLSTNELLGLQIVVRGWDADCSGNFANNTYKVRSRHRITNAAYELVFGEQIVDLSVNYLSGFGTYEQGEFYDIIIGADIVDPGPTGPCMWILDSSNNFYGPSGSSLPDGTTGVNNVICGPSCCIAGILDGGMNTLVGAAAGGQMVSGDNNVFIGAATGTTIANADGNILVGAFAGFQAKFAGAADNIFIGRSAGYAAPDSSGNIGIGCKAGAGLSGVSGGDFNINIGWESGNSGVSGECNIGLGCGTLSYIDGNRNIEIGLYNGVGRIMDSTIILNASGDGFDASSNAFYVNPLRSATQSNVLYYNTSTKEITYNTSEAATDISGIWTFDSSNNFYGPSGASMNDPQGSAEKNTFGGVSVATSVSFSGFNNTAFGYEAFQLGGDSEENVAIGGQALKSVETGGNNTAVGYQALSLATSSGNTAVGTTAGVGLTTGGNNTIMGAAGGEGLTTGSNNLVLGYAAFSTAAGDTSGCICLNATGTDFSPALSDMSSQFFVKPIRSSSQPNALYYEPTSGEITYDLSGGSGGGGGGGGDTLWVNDGNNNFYGPSGEAGVVGFGGSGNIAVGVGAMNNDIVTGNFNVAVGRDALLNNNSGEHNVAVGREAMRDNTGGLQNTAIGHQAMAINTTGDRNVAVGDDALLANFEGDFNTALGWAAMGQGAGSNNSQNVAVGCEALLLLEGGHNNIAIGRAALAEVRDTSSNIAIGSFAMGGYMRSGSENVAVGHHALYNVSGGFSNVAIGYHAGRGGDFGAFSNYDVSGSVFIGYKAGDPGGFGGSAAVTGTGNVIIGYEAQGKTNSLSLTGVDCTLVGTQTEVSQGVTNVTLLGARAKADGVNSRCIVLYAGDASLNAANASSFTVKPIRSSSQPNALYYEPTSGEITYDLSGGSGGGGGGGSPGILVIEGPASGTGLSGEGLPTPMPSLVKITLVGGGGGGGGGASGGKAGGGGGGGAAWILWSTDTDLLTTTAWQVGATGGGFGAAGAAGVTGQTGQNSFIGARQATGGDGGDGGTGSGIGGHGGVPSGSTPPSGSAISLNGQTGNYDVTHTISQSEFECLGGGAGAGLGQGGYVSGSSAGYGNGGRGGIATGGAGGSTSGQNGVMIVEWW